MEPTYQLLKGLVLSDPEVETLGDMIRRRHCRDGITDSDRYKGNHGRVIGKLVFNTQLGRLRREGWSHLEFDHVLLKVMYDSLLRHLRRTISEHM